MYPLKNYFLVILASIIGSIMFSSCGGTTNLVGTGNEDLKNYKEILILNKISEPQENGDVETEANFSIGNFGFGTLRIMSPATIKPEESSVIRLIVTPDDALEDLPKVSMPTISNNSSLYALQFNDRLLVFPVMTARLVGINFKIVSDGSENKAISPELPAEWLWNIAPNENGGKQILFITISIPILVNGDLTSSQILKGIPLEILIEFPTPTQTQSPTITPLPSSTPTLFPTETPTLSPIRRIENNIIDNVGIIVVAVVGLVGTLITVLVSLIIAQRRPDIEPTAKGIEQQKINKKKITRSKSNR